MGVTAHVYVIWSMTSATRFRLEELFEQYCEAEEDSDEAEAITGAIRSLPGFPHQAPIGSDFLYEVTDTHH